MRPIKYTIALTDDEITRLTKIVKDKTTNQIVKKRYSLNQFQSLISTLIDRLD